MPRGDRTGPAGMGPMTGRGAGFCAGNSNPGYTSGPGVRGGGGGMGRGMRRGRGGGWGGGGGGGWRHRHWYYATGLPGWQRAGMYGPGYGPEGAAPVAPTAPMMTKEQELEALKSQAEYFEKSMEDVRSRISEIESTDEGSNKT